MCIRDRGSLKGWEEDLRSSLEKLQKLLAHDCIEEEAAKLFAAKAKVVEATLDLVSSDAVEAA
eukprot:3917706-Alexandrium_andersonii.AAC.1